MKIRPNAPERVKVGDGFDGWLRRDRSGNLILARGRHRGSLLAGAPEGYLRHLLHFRLPPLVRMRILEALGEIDVPLAPAERDGEWVPFLLGDVSGYVQADVARLFLAEYRRVAGLLETDRPTPVLEAIAALSSTTPSESLR